MSTGLTGVANEQLLADDFARNGFKVVMPDVFDGEPAPVEALRGPEFDMWVWFARHPPARGLEIVRSVMAALKAEGVTKFGGLGYCYGGRVCFDLAFAGEIAAVATSHPSMLKAPEDFQKYLEVSKAPLLINSCEIDPVYGPADQAKTDEVLGGGKYKPGYRRTYWEGCVHGFAVSFFRFSFVLGQVRVEGGGREWLMRRPGRSRAI